MLADDRAGSKVEVPQLVKGDKPNAKKPSMERKGVSFTAVGILNLWERKETIKSTTICVVKLISTNAPKRE